MKSLIAALVLLIAALFTPRWNLPHDTFEYVVFFDITQSMDVADYDIGGAPVSRLDFAKRAVARELRDLPCGSRVGWGAFAEYRSLLLLSPVEVCANYNDLLASLAQIDGRMRWAEASEIVKGLRWAIEAAQSTPTTPNLVFESDGQEAPPLEGLDLQSVLEKVKDHAVHGWIIGTGGDEPSPIPKIDTEGNHHGFWRPDEVIQSESTADGATPGLEHYSALREPHLTSLAHLLNLDYARLSDAKSLSAAMTDDRFGRRRQVPTDLSWVAAALALLLLIVRFRPPLPKLKA